MKPRISQKFVFNYDDLFRLIICCNKIVINTFAWLMSNEITEENFVLP